MTPATRTRARGTTAASSQTMPDSGRSLHSSSINNHIYIYTYIHSISISISRLSLFPCVPPYRVFLPYWQHYSEPACAALREEEWQFPAQIMPVVR